MITKLEKILETWRTNTSIGGEYSLPGLKKPLQPLFQELMSYAFPSPFQSHKGDFFYAQLLLVDSELKIDNDVLYSFCEKKDFKGVDGIFLSAMMKTIPEDEIKIPGMQNKCDNELTGIRHLGCFLTEKTLTVEGDVGSRAGYHMLQGGRMVVEGNAGAFAGSKMCDGELIIEGNTGENLGSEMRDGEILVNGSVGGTAGKWMRGGQIIIKGDTGDFLGKEMRGGTIHVLGNVGGHIGKGMTSGKIITKGKGTYPYDPISRLFVEKRRSKKTT
ncbi:MAG: hypothetical protein GOU97_02580 [Nanoarchaeota archaeon]|nr:hypothetical protein [Nanoarchaeota archaeon]